MEFSSRSEGVDPIEGACTLQQVGDSSTVPAQFPLPWLREHEWHLPSSTAVRKNQGRGISRPGSTSKVVPWLMQRPSDPPGNSDCTLSADGGPSPYWFACKGSHNALLPAEGIHLFLLCYVAYAVLYFTRKPFSIVKEELRSQLGISTFVLGWIDTAFLGCYAGGQLLMPFCISRLSGAQLNMLLTGCFFGSCLAAFVFGCSSSSAWFVAVWGLNGLVHSPAFPILIKILSTEVPPSSRGSVMGVWTTSQQLGKDPKNQ